MVAKYLVLLVLISAFCLCTCEKSQPEKALAKEYEEPLKVFILQAIQKLRELVTQVWDNPPEPEKFKKIIANFISYFRSMLNTLESETQNDSKGTNWPWTAPPVSD